MGILFNGIPLENQHVSQYGGGGGEGGGYFGN